MQQITIFEYLEYMEAQRNVKNDYLNRSERIETLAREKILRTYGNFQFSELEKKILSVKYLKRNTTGKLENITILSPLAKVFRCVLKTIKTFDENDEGIKVIRQLFGEELIIEESPMPSRAFSSKMNGRIMKISIKKGEKQIIFHGAVDYAHAEKKRNAYFPRSYEGCADIGYFFAYLYMLKSITKALHNAAKNGGRFYEENKKLLEGSLEEELPGIYAQPQLCVRSVLSEHQSAVLHRLFGQKLSEGTGDGFPLMSYQVNNIMKMYAVYEVFTGEKEALDIFDCVRQISPKSSNYAALPQGGYEVGFYYDLFLSAIAEQNDLFQTFEHMEETKTLAKAWQTKKNIPEKVLKAMKESKFNDYFGYVEFDEETDLDKMSELILEFKSVMDTFFSFIDLSEYQIRFRKLGKHHAIGLFVPPFNCLCVDIRAPRSFIHEFGHLIDYKYMNCSLSSDFWAIRQKYTEIMNRRMKNDGVWNGSTKYNMDYYLKPTEIFARAFERYMSEAGVNNSLLEEKEKYEKSPYYPDDEEFKELVKVYFDNFLEEQKKTAQHKNAG